jgi:uncharacterized protein
MLLLSLLVISTLLGGVASSTEQEWYLDKVKRHEAGDFPFGRIHVLRLRPNEDLLESLWAYARVKSLKAASIVSVVGSLIQTNIRYANQQTSTKLTGHYEIVSVVGNLDFQKVNNADYQPSGHVHISCSGEAGETVGGHLLSENLVYTTAEITLLELDGAIFDRVLDDDSGGSGYYELKVFNTSTYHQ